MYLTRRQTAQGPRWALDGNFSRSSLSVVSYVYDGLSRLTRAAHSTGDSFEYANDAVGNRVTYTHTFSSQQKRLSESLLQAQRTF